MTDSMVLNCRGRVTKHAQAIANALREIADKIEREIPKDDVDNLTIEKLSRLVENTQHAVLWGVPNLNLQHMVASLFDVIEIEAIVAKEEGAEFTYK